MIVALAKAAEPNCDPTVSVNQALDSFGQIDLEAAKAALVEAEVAAGCSGVVSPETLGQWWLIDGAIADTEGDTAGAVASWKAAGRVAPELWIADFGEVLKARWVAANDAPGSEVGRVNVEPTLPEGYSAWIDGVEVSLPIEVPVGLHLVQIGRTEGAMSLARMVVVSPQAEFTLGHQLRAIEAPPRAIAVQLHVGLGTEFSFGKEVQVGELIEPGTKAIGDLTVGARLGWKSLWLRVVAGMSVFPGKWIVGTGLDEQTQSPTGATQSAVGGSGSLGIGAHLGLLEIGIEGGIFWPRRIPLGGVASVQLGKTPLRAEVRGGTFLVAESKLQAADPLPVSLEPYVGLSVVWTPDLLR